jgi:hypothetical protein
MKHLLTLSIAVALLTVTSAVALAGSIEPGDHMEMAAVLKAPVTPTRAVQIAEAGGGRAYGYGMEANPHGHWYEVAVLRGGAKLELRIDATTGKLLGSGPARGEDAQGAHALAGSKLAFGEAIAAAERVGQGPALEADAAGRGSTAHVEVDVIQNHGARIAHYKVTMRNGQIHAVETGSDS